MTASLLVTAVVPALAAETISTTSSQKVMPDPAVNGCDVLLEAPVDHHCLLPWPNDAFTIASPTATGRRLNISSSVDPSNLHGVHVDTSAQNAGDGFSPGAVIMTYVSGLSIAASRIATSTNIGLSLAPNAPIVILDTATGERVPYFAELDAQVSDGAKQLLLILPVVALTEGHRYAVVLRHLYDANYERIAPLASTKAALAGTLQPAERGAHIRWVIRHDLASVLGSSVPFQAWDFTVASKRSLAGPALTMRELAYQWLDTHHVASAGEAAAVEEKDVENPAGPPRAARSRLTCSAPSWFQLA